MNYSFPDMHMFASWSWNYLLAETDTGPECEFDWRERKEEKISTTELEITPTVVIRQKCSLGITIISIYCGVVYSISCIHSQFLSEQVVVESNRSISKNGQLHYHQHNFNEFILLR